MKALLYKDFRTIWRQMKAFLLLIAVFCLVPNDSFFNMGTFFVLYAGVMIPLSLMSLDERAHWDSFAAMLPYADRAVVLSRYVVSWLCVLFASVMYTIGSVLSADPLARMATLGWLLALFLVTQSILFPFLFRHGVEKARIYMMIFLLAVVVVSMGLVALAGEVIPLDSRFLPGILGIALGVGLVLCMASVPLSVRQYRKHQG